MRATAAACLGLWLLVSPGSASAQSKECINASDQGQQLRDQGKYRAAHEAFAVCARETCPALVRRDCGQWLNDLNQTSPTVVVSAKDDKGSDLVDVKVTMDGTVLATKLNGEPMMVDTGPHTFTYETAGFPPSEEKVLVLAGERTRILKVQFGSAKGTQTASAEARSSAGGEAGAPSSRRGPPLAAWVFTGVAGLAFVSEAYFGLTGLGDYNSDKSGCGKTSTCDPSSVNDIRTHFTIADISLGVGIASGLVAGYFFLFAPQSSASPGPQVGRAQVGLSPLPGGGAATLGASF